MNGVRTFRTVAATEFRMAARSRVAWLSVVPLLVVSCLAAVASQEVISGPSAVRIGTCALLTNMFVTLGIGVALADRLVRTHGLGLDELLTALPAAPFARLLGGLAGSLAAALAPVLGVLCGVGAVASVVDRNAFALPSAVAAFVVIVLPGALLMSVAASAAGLVLPLPAVRVTMIVVWFWATLFNRSMIPLPTPTGTLFSPLGDYAATAWWGVSPVWAGRGNPVWLSPATTPAAAAANVLAVLGVTAVLLLVAWRLSAWKRQRA